MGRMHFWSVLPTFLVHHCSLQQNASFGMRPVSINGQRVRTGRASLAVSVTGYTPSTCCEATVTLHTMQKPILAFVDDTCVWMHAAALGPASAAAAKLTAYAC